MILLPSDLAGMHLGVHKAWTPAVPQPRGSPSRPALTVPPPLSWGRVGCAPRCKGFNDRVGDCVPTGCINFVLDYKGAVDGNFDPIPDELAIDIFSDVTGYNGTPETDHGTDPNAMFAWWQQNPIAGWKLKSATPFDPTQLVDVEDAISGMAACVGVVDLRVAQQNQLEWRPDGDQTMWGYHFVCFDQYVGPFSGTSWGREQWAAREFFTAGRVLQCWDLTLTQ